VAARLLVLTDRYFRALARIGVRPRTPQAQRVARVLRALEGADVLPGEQDDRAVIPPTVAAFVRRVPKANLWVWYTLDGERVIIQAITAHPPAPL
jgi:hypothetical protein